MASTKPHHSSDHIARAPPAKSIRNHANSAYWMSTMDHKSMS